MGLMSGILGNASEISIEQVEKDYGILFVDGETIEKAFLLIRDVFIFTNKRLILVDKQGITGKKTEVMSIPYSKINTFSVETAGHLDLDAELKIWISGVSLPISKKFNKKTNIYDVQKLLATHVL